MTITLELGTYTHQTVYGNREIRSEADRVLRELVTGECSCDGLVEITASRRGTVTVQSDPHVWARTPLCGLRTGIDDLPFEDQAGYIYLDVAVRMLPGAGILHRPVLVEAAESYSKRRTWTTRLGQTRSQ